MFITWHIPYYQPVYCIGTLTYPLSDTALQSKKKHLGWSNHTVTMVAHVLVRYWYWPMLYISLWYRHGTVTIWASLALFRWDSRPFFRGESTGHPKKESVLCSLDVLKVATLKNALSSIPVASDLRRYQARVAPLQLVIVASLPPLKSYNASVNETHMHKALFVAFAWYLLTNITTGIPA